MNDRQRLSLSLLGTVLAAVMLELLASAFEAAFWFFSQALERALLRAIGDGPYKPDSVDTALWTYSLWLSIGKLLLGCAVFAAGIWLALGRVRSAPLFARGALR